MVGAAGVVLDDAGLIVQEGIGINEATDWPTIQDLFLHRRPTADAAIVNHCGIGVVAETGARTTLFREAATSAGNVLCVARKIHVWAKAFFGIGGASQIWIAGFVTDACASQRVNTLVYSLIRTTMA